MFYIYVYLDPRKPGNFEYNEYCFLYEPFYVGKGSSDRMYDHLKKSELLKNTFKSNKIKSILSSGHEPYIIKIVDNIIEEKLSYELEQEIVFNIGRIMTNNGPLVNLKEGGKGGLTGYIYSEEQLRQKSITSRRVQSCPKYKELRKEIGKSIYKNEETKLKHRENTIKGLTKEAIEKSKIWLLDDCKKQNMIYKVKDTMSKNKELRSTIQKESWSDIKLIERHSNIMKEISNRPDVKKKIRDASIKKVYQYTIDGDLIKVWNSVIDASIDLKISSSAIANNCRGLSKKSNGFIWSYHELV
jgi:hypothetical protein